ncbi:E3 ubiquitin-protein ligase MARCH3 [Collichthys lucidus]|uniref:E3 ubiquitin-protein ligase MARCH3 n=1 Tax=Collichthys lucidus TaxID=240159 RepID=A0A4U5U5D2_COLLU|nr:E3 ubiquitin-protein ligase MARCH3 [Collichthys lucidus]
MTVQEHLGSGCVSSPVGEVKLMPEHELKKELNVCNKEVTHYHLPAEDRAEITDSLCNEELFCRICHEGRTSGKLLSLCECSGSLAMVHRACLEHWLTTSNSSLCELCHHQFTLERLPKPLAERFPCVPFGLDPRLFLDPDFAFPFWIICLLHLIDFPCTEPLPEYWLPAESASRVLHLSPVSVPCNRTIWPAMDSADSDAVHAVVRAQGSRIHHQGEQLSAVCVVVNELKDHQQSFQVSVGSEWFCSASMQQQRRTLCGDIICFLFITPLAGLSGWLCVQGAMDLYNTNGMEAMGLLVLTLALFTIYVFWTMVSVRYHMQLFKTWKRTDQRVRLQIPSPSHTTHNQQALSINTLCKATNKETMV